MQLHLIDVWRAQALLLDMLVVIVLLVSLKYLKGIFANVNSQSELVDRNNAAFGISFGGGIVSLGLVLSGVSAGGFADSLSEEAMSMAIFGVLGLVLVLAGRLFQDKLVLSKIEIHAELAKNNIACALVDVGHMISIGMIIRAAMIWVPSSDFATIPVLLLSFVLSQLIITIASVYRTKLFQTQNKDHQPCLQTVIGNGFEAVALRYSGFCIGVSLMVTASSHLVTFDPLAYWKSTLYWALFAILSLPIYALLVQIVRRLVLPGVDMAQEIDRENNIGIAAVEAAIFMAIGAVCVALI